MKPSTGPDPKYCSSVCRSRSQTLRAQAIRDTSDRECPWCLKTFAYVPNKKFCSSECSHKSNAHIKIYRAPDRCSLPVCVDCRKIYSAEGKVVVNRRYRCSDCAASYKRTSNNARWKKKNAVRRSAFAAGEKIDTIEVAEREGWQCHLCLELIDPELRAPHPGSLTLDHLIPLNPRPGEPAGTHTADNVKVAHWGCNSRRQNRPLRLAS